MKVAIVHDQLCEFGGAERVLLVFKKIFPQAKIFTSTLNFKKLGNHRNFFENCQVEVSWFGKIPIIKNYYSPFRFLTPQIWQSFDFSQYQLVISSSGSWMSKGVITKPPTVHISYIHHPPRYLYGYETAIEWQKYPLIKLYGNIVNHYLRLWDYQASQRPDYLIANSYETQRRIKKFYRREAEVIYPPVNIPKINLKNKKPVGDFFITISRLARAKHIDILIRAANKMKLKLKIIGSGKDEKNLRSIAGPTVEFLGNLSDEKLGNYLSKAKGFLFAAVDEEFGIAPVEAMGYGLPVIAYRSGGIPEYIEDGKNGFLFNELNENFLMEKIKQLLGLNQETYFKIKLAARKKAEQFSEEIFRKKIKKIIKSKIKI
ncbi:MAG: glycosyltransferase [Microgenomates group bacterium]|nr:glycosyltransferase [Microgenomates group bacterium]